MGSTVDVPNDVTGDVFCWGLGVSSDPVEVESLRAEKIRQLAAGYGQVIAVTGEGRVHHLTLEENEQREELESAFANLNILQVACGRDHSIAADVDGLVYTWGTGNQGQLGLGHGVGSYIPRPVTILKSKFVIKVACGSAHTAALTNAGDLYTWGRSFEGQTGHGVVKRQGPAFMDNVSCGVQLAPRFVAAFLRTRVVEVSCGAMFTAAVTEPGDVWTWGEGIMGQLGIGRMSRNPSPSLVLGPGATRSGAPFVGVACGWGHTIAVTSEGNLHCWGLNSHGQLGLGDFETRFVPEPLTQFSQGFSFASVSAGGHYTAALTSSGALWSWGGRGRVTSPHHEAQTSARNVSPNADVAGALLDAGARLSRGAGRPATEPGANNTVGSSRPDSAASSATLYTARTASSGPRDQERTPTLPTKGGGRLGHIGQDHVGVPRMVKGVIGRPVAAVACADHVMLAFTPSRVLRVSPTSGSMEGGTMLEISGAGFWDHPGIRVRFAPVEDANAIPHFEVDQQVEREYDGIWLPAIVTACHDDDTYDIYYPEDDYTDDNVPVDELRFTEQRIVEQAQIVPGSYNLDRGAVLARVPAFAAPCQVAVEVAANGVDFTSNGVTFTLREPTRVLSVTPNLVPRMARARLVLRGVNFDGPAVRVRFREVIGRGVGERLGSEEWQIVQNQAPSAELHAGITEVKSQTVSIVTNARRGRRKKHRVTTVAPVSVVDNSCLIVSAPSFRGTMPLRVHVDVALNGIDFTESQVELMFYEETVLRCVPRSAPRSGGTTIHLVGSGFVTAPGIDQFAHSTRGIPGLAIADVPRAAAPDAVPMALADLSRQATRAANLAAVPPGDGSENKIGEGLPVGAADGEIEYGDGRDGDSSEGRVCVRVRRGVISRCVPARVIDAGAVAFAMPFMGQVAVAPPEPEHGSGDEVGEDETKRGRSSRGGRGSRPGSGLRRSSSRGEPDAASDLASESGESELANGTTAETSIELCAVAEPDGSEEVEVTLSLNGIHFGAPTKLTLYQGTFTFATPALAPISGETPIAVHARAPPVVKEKRKRRKHRGDDSEKKEDAGSPQPTTSTATDRAATTAAVERSPEEAAKAALDALWVFASEEVAVRFKNKKMEEHVRAVYDEEQHAVLCTIPCMPGREGPEPPNLVEGRREVEWESGRSWNTDVSVAMNGLDFNSGAPVKITYYSHPKLGRIEPDNGPPGTEVLLFGSALFASPHATVRFKSEESDFTKVVKGVFDEDLRAIRCTAPTNDAPDGMDAPPALNGPVIVEVALNGHNYTVDALEFVYRG